MWLSYASPCHLKASWGHPIYDMSRQQNVGKWWILTIPQEEFTPYLPPGVTYIKGQLETAASGFIHWQAVCCMQRTSRLSALRSLYGSRCHAELTRSSAARDYVHKEATRISGLIK